MFKRFKPPASKPSNTPQWVKWGVVIFLLVIFLYNSRSIDGGPSQLQRSADSITNELPKAEDYTKHIPEFNEVSVEKLSNGEGALILCGQNITLDYIAMREGREIGKGKITQRFLPSEGEAFIRPYLAGMQLGDSKSLIFSKPQLLSDWLDKGAEGSMDQLQFTVNQAEPQSPLQQGEQGLGIQITDRKLGQGSSVKCGQAVRAQYKLYTPQGLLDDEAETTFVIGKGQVISGLEQGVIGMQPGGVRQLILPAAWQKHLYPNDALYKAIKANPKGELMVLEVELK